MALTYAALLGLAVTITMGLASPAYAEPAMRDRAESALDLAEREDSAFELFRALEHYDESLALDPTNVGAERRAALLRSHSEGSFLPFAALERVRRDTALSNSPRAIDALVRDADKFPPGQVRIEVWVLAAEALSQRFDRPNDAQHYLRRVLEDPQTDDVTAQKAARDLVTLALAHGDFESAKFAVVSAGSRADAHLARDVARALLRQRIHRAVVAMMTAFLVMATRSLIAAASRGELSALRAALAKTWSFVFGYAAYVAILGACLASGYETGTASPFLLFGAVLVPIAMLARAWSAVGLNSDIVRAARAVLCGAAVFGSGFLVLENASGTYLESLGL